MRKMGVSGAKKKKKCKINKHCNIKKVEKCLSLIYYVKLFRKDRN